MTNYVDLATIFDPAPDEAPPAEWGDQIRDNFAHLMERTERVIVRQVLGAPATNIASGTLPTVTNGWKLRIVVEAQHASSSVAMGLRFNGDSGSNYHRQYISAQDTTLAGDGQTSLDKLFIGTVGNASVNRWATIDLSVYGYLASRHKSALGMAHDPGNLTTTAFAQVVGGTWLSTAAITSVSVHAESGNLVAGSSLTILATPVP